MTKVLPRRGVERDVAYRLRTLGVGQPANDLAVGAAVAPHPRAEALQRAYIAATSAAHNALAQDLPTQEPQERDEDLLTVFAQITASQLAYLARRHPNPFALIQVRSQEIASRVQMILLQRRMADPAAASPEATRA